MELLSAFHQQWQLDFADAAYLHFRVDGLINIVENVAVISQIFSTLVLILNFNYAVKATSTLDGIPSHVP